MIKFGRARIISLGLLFLIVAIFLYLKIVPFGHISYSRSFPEYFKSGQGFIYGFSPAERIDLKSGAWPRLIGDPVYFSLFTPRTFDTAKLIITYRSHLRPDTPIIEAGVLADKLVWRYDLEPLENQVLDKFRSSWPALEKPGTNFLQATKNYASLADFQKDLAVGRLKNCPGGANTCIAVYNYPLDIEDYPPDNEILPPVTIDKPLRGEHQFYLYLNSKILHLDFDFTILNQDKDPDPITITIYSQGKVVITKQLTDEGLDSTSGRVEEKQLSLEVPDLPVGVYKVEVKISPDTVIKKIKSSAGRLAFINKLWPVSTPGDLTLYTDTNYLQVKALSPASVQTINFAGQDFRISAAYDQFNFQVSSDQPVKTIKLKKDDVVLETNGVFAWSPQALFNPTSKKIDRFFQTKGLVNYIIANYQPPLETKDGWKIATAEFDLHGAYRENGQYNLMISVPGLKADSGSDNYLEIKKITIELNGRTLWQKIWQ